MFDENGNLILIYGPSQVNHETKGVYSIDILVPTTANNVETMYNDVWQNVTINGVTRPDVTLDFVVKDSFEYYNMNGDSLPKKVGVSIAGLQNMEKIKRGDIRKVLVSARIPYTVEQSQSINNLKYRLYVSEGSAELTVIDFQPVEMAVNNYYFLLWHLRLKLTSNLIFGGNFFLSKTKQNSAFSKRPAIQALKCSSKAKGLSNSSSTRARCPRLKIQNLSMKSKYDR